MREEVDLLASKKACVKSLRFDRKGQGTQDALRLVLSEIESLVKKTPVSLVKNLNQDGVICRWDSACENIYGYTTCEAIGRRLEELLVSRCSKSEVVAFSGGGSHRLISGPAEEKPKIKTTEDRLRHSGVKIIGDIPWGTHFCHFYQTKDDLIEILVPYFKEGLEDNEYCMWLTCEPLDSEQAGAILGEKIENFDKYVKKGQIEIIDCVQWYVKNGRFDMGAVLKGWAQKEKKALERGFEGLRLAGNTFWLDKEYWPNLVKYEEVVNDTIGKSRILAICGYCLDKCTGAEIIDVVGSHQSVLVRRDGRWKLIESCERRRAIEALHKSEQQYKILVETIPHGIKEIDINGRIIFANKSMHKIYGFSEGELQGKEIFDLPASKTEQERLRQYFAQLKKGQLLPIPYETKIRTKDGRVIDVQVHWSYKRNDLGCVTGFTRVITDITESKEFEKALLRERDNLIGILSAMQDGVYITDQDYNIQYVNPCLVKDFGVLNGRQWKCYEYFHGWHKPCSWCNMENVAAGRSVYREWYSTRNAKTYDLVETAVKNHDGTILKLGILHDITDHKDLEERQRLEEEILKCINQQVSAADLICDVLSLVKKATGLENVVVCLNEQDGFRCYPTDGLSCEAFRVDSSGCAGNGDGAKSCYWRDNPLLEYMQDKVMTKCINPAVPFFTEGGSFWTESATKLLTSAPPEAMELWAKADCPRIILESVAIIPLYSGDQITGMLQLSDRWPRRIGAEMVRFFEKIAASLGIALARIKAEEQAENLARFPSENPCPVLRIDSRGIILYSNAAGRKILDWWKCRVGDRISEDWCVLIAETLDCGTNGIRELECGDRIFSLVINPIQEGGYVNLYGSDVTEQRMAEQEILKFNKELERRVAERTARLARVNNRLRREIEQRKRLEREILDITERERRRIGRELHDSIGQQFTGIALLVKVLEQKLTGRLSEEAEKAAEIGQLVNHATNQTRSLARGLHPVSLHTNNLASALQELAASTQLLFNVRCDFRCERPVPMDDTATAVHLYRIAQEAITNAVKHARAGRIKIELVCGEHQSTLLVKNDGLDFPERPPKDVGMGLQIMDHRVAMIGGRLSIFKHPEGGTILSCVFPNKRPKNKPRRSFDKTAG